MSKLSKAVRPYSYQAKLQLLLTLSAITACMVSLACSFAYTHYITRVDLADQEYNLAISMLELNQKTNLSTDEILTMSQQENVLLERVPQFDLMLTGQQMDQLESHTILSIVGGFNTMPVTYVQLDNAVVRISSSKRANLFLNTFWRMVFLCVALATVFLLVSMISAHRIAQPISELTHATQLISSGDFSVQLPEDQDDEIGELMRSFNGMTDALQRTSWLQKDFIANVSHEFRTPIASIKGYARLLQMPDLDEETRKEYVQMIAQESDRLSRLSETLLRLTALEQQTAPATLSTFHLDEQVRQVMLRLEPVWSQKKLELELNLSPVTVETDADLLLQVWTNLIHNAVKFSSEGGLLEITVRKTDMAEFEVTDHGVGMDEKTLNRIFERFYQADASRSHEGVGLGLSLVQRILVILNGEITVRSRPQMGTTVRVRIPFHPVSKAQHKEEPHENVY